MTTKISVVIPTYNRSDKLLGAIESVLAQTLAVYEIILVDDGSTDDTREAVSRFVKNARSSDPPIHYLYQEQQGVSGARNTGIEKATGEWIAFLDSDDRWLPKKLACQMQTLETFGANYQACFTDAHYVNNPDWYSTVFQRSDGPFEEPAGCIQNAAQFILGATNGHGIYIQTLVIRRDLLSRFGGFDPHLKVYEDHDFVFRMALHCKYCYVNECLVEVDRTPGRREGLIELHAKESFRLEQLDYMYGKWLAADLTLDAANRRLLVLKIRSNRAAWASCHLINGEYARALDAMTATLHYGFTLQSAVKWALIRVVPNTMRRFVQSRYQRRLNLMLPGLEQ